MTRDPDPDTERGEVEWMMRHHGVDVRTALAMIDQAEAERLRTCEHDHHIGISPCGQCPCPSTLGDHVWAEQDSGDTFSVFGGGLMTRVVYWTACDECGATPPEKDGDDW